MAPIYVEVVLPLQLRKPLTYEVPPHLLEEVEVGRRVEVQLGNKRRYAGVVIKILDSYNAVRKPKDIIDVLDVHPIIHPWQIELWTWIRSYYMCTLGEVLHAALPSGLKLSSESILILNAEQPQDDWSYNDGEKILLEALYHRNEITVEDAADLIHGGYSYRVIKSLLEKGDILIKERLKEKSGPKTLKYVDFTSDYASEEGLLIALEDCSRAPQQTKALLALYELRRSGMVTLKELKLKSGCTTNVIKALAQKDIIAIKEELAHKIVRDEGQSDNQLNDEQISAWKEIQSYWMEEGPVTLLEGVTGSGKTHIYLEAIKQCIERGKQALYLLPEIALTTQLIQRLQFVFGEKLVTYHSRLNDRERTAVYEVVRQGHPVVIGARSSLLLPFENLGLIIVDEEHDQSYKQNDPSPRYHARDTAVFMAHRWKIPVLMGSATPSLESMYNVLHKKYGYSRLLKRFSNNALPDIELIDLKKAYQKNQVIEHFSKEGLERIAHVIERGQQVLIFQNRRGHSHITRCASCGWTAECIKCDVSLTYHKVFKDLRCHYCGFREELPRLCPSCGNPGLEYKGLGTQKIENDLQVHFPNARIGRMDSDTARGTKARSQLIEQVEAHDLDILIGTQMVTKGLDFEKIALVIVPQADQLLHYPDFRTNEKAYQMLLQVSGRAGRRDQKGHVLIQTYTPGHPVLQSLIHQKQEEFFKNELAERKEFLYPPYYRLIQLEIKHKKAGRTQQAAEEVALRLKHDLGNRVIGPAEPSIARIRNQYVRHIFIKHEKQASSIQRIKKTIQQAIDETAQLKNMSTVRFNINVDPM